MTINVSAGNDAPVAVDDSLNASEDTPVTYAAADLLGNDSDVDGDTLTIASVTAGSGGTVVLNGDGTVTFTPDAAFVGAATFTYSITDGALTSNTATVTVNVGAVNHAPVAFNDLLATSRDTVAIFSAAQLLDNDSDMDGDTLVIASVSSGTGGSVVLNGDGTVIFTPDTNFVGQASFTYTVTDGAQTSNTATVTVNVTAVNDAPVALDDVRSASEDSPVTFSAAQLLGNDSDANGDSLAIASVSSGAGGSVVLNPNGSVTFTPDANFQGPATFSYQVTDGELASNVATVTVNVAAANDAPEAGKLPDGSPDPAFNPSSGRYEISTPEDVPRNGSVSAFDLDGDTLSYSLNGGPTHGTVTLDPASGGYTYTPAANYHGPDSFVVRVIDGQGGSTQVSVAITVTPVNDGPVASPDSLTATRNTAATYGVAQLLGNDSDIDGDPLTLVGVSNGVGGSVVLNPNGTVTFTPDANFVGQASFTYTVTDGSLTSTGSVTVTIAAVNDAPLAVNDQFDTDEDRPVIISAAQLLGNDSDANGDTLSIVGVSNGVGGSVVLNPDNTLTFTPTPDFNGPATFNYSITDGNLISTATVTVNVAPVNDAPQGGKLPGGGADPAFNASTGRYEISTPQGVPTAGAVSAHDLDGDSLTYSISGAPAHGSLTLNPATGGYTYVPAANYQGGDSFVVTVADGRGGTTTITVLIEVTPVVPPVQPIQPVPPVQITPMSPIVVASPGLPSTLEPSAPAPSAVAPFDSAFTTASGPTEWITASPLAFAIQRFELERNGYRDTLLGEVYTSNTGFRVVVIEASNPSLSLFRGVTDQYADAGTVTSFSVPYDAFAHTDPNERILLTARLANGQPLPDWVVFDAQSGTFELIAPKGYRGELTIKVTARDSQGREVSALFRVRVGESKGREGARAGLSDQLRAAAQRPGLAFAERAGANNNGAPPRAEVKPL